MKPRENIGILPLLQIPKERMSRGSGWFGGAAADVYWGPVSLCQILGALPLASFSATSVVAVELRGQTLQQGQGHGVPVGVPGTPTLGSWWGAAGAEEPVLCQGWG